MFMRSSVTIAKTRRGCMGLPCPVPRGRDLFGFLVLFFSQSDSTNAQPFTDIAAGLQGVGLSSAAWGDCDNDGDLDILLTGTDASFNLFTRVYRSDGTGSFNDISAGLPGIYGSSVAWGDQDDDGDLDILLTGYDGVATISRVYRNDGVGGFHDIVAGISGVYNSSVAWGDQDNDGDLDILLTGYDGGTTISRVYRNDGVGGLHDISAGLPGVEFSSVGWGDYDNDGDLDILLTGYASGTSISRVYRNDGAGGFHDIVAGLTGVYNSSVAWGDQDNDGDLDILLSGYTNAGPISRVYRHDGAGSFNDIVAGLTGVNNSSVAWGDHDNDGDLDILLTGYDGLQAIRISRVYRNDGVGGFNDISAGLPGVEYSSVGWGDYDNDGDLDILLTGYAGGAGITLSRVYRNETPTGNAVPSAPTNLASQRFGGLVTFSWTGATDDHTPTAGLSYNLRIGTTPGGNEIMPAMAAANGYRRVARLGNGQLRTSWTLTLPDGIYYWSVQAIDGAFLGSSFAPEETLTPPFTDFTDIGAGLPGVEYSSAAWGDFDNDEDLDILLSGMTASGPISRVYRNDGAGNFQNISAVLEGVQNSSVAWGDYDNDGDLDILVTGVNGSSTFVSQVYRNDDGGAFHDINAGLPGVGGSSVAWGDYDNDGDLDILLSGDANLVGTAVYRNMGGGVFQDIQVALPDVRFSSVAWGDHDNDGDLDILLTGQDTEGTPRSGVYRNDGSGSFNDIAVGLPGVYQSSATWGDYDHDGDLDILLTGETNSGGISQVYRNDGGGAFSNIWANLPGAYFSSAAWGDYDNDGDLDIALTGLTDPLVISVLYKYDGINFVEVDPPLPLVSRSSVAWGDYDKDGDLDLLLTGYESTLGPISRVYRNESTDANSAPSAPGNLAAVRNGDEVTFSWDGSSDDHTPAAGLSYNLRVGTTPGGDQLEPAMADGSGFRRVARLGNGQLRTSWTLSLPEGTYRWSVQAIDGAFLGSPFASEMVFPPFTEMTAGLPGVQASSVAWGDYDNDGDLDILLTGTDGVSFFSRIYRRNADGVYFDIAAGLPGVSQSSVAWGDYDNDGDLDILLTGYPGAAVISRIYRNDGAASFHDISAGLPGVSVSSAAWGDYDNDGDLDILLTGSGSAAALSRVYRNDGSGSFLDISAGLPGVYYSSAAWGDADSDEDLDILLTGSSDFGAISRVYRNDGDGAFNDLSAGLPGVTYSSAAWGDQDADGDLDILLTGASASGIISRVYRNDGGGTFSNTPAVLPGVYFSSAAWGDYDNDGDLDILLTGFDATFSPLSRVYRNDGGGNFDEISGGLLAVGNSSAAWGDYENDGDLDILISGEGASGPVTRIHRNQTPTANTAPSAPASLGMTRNGDQVTFSWTAAADDHTPTAGLSYNLRIGTTPGGSEIMPAMASVNGYRRVPRLGNAGGQTSWTLTLPDGVYYWGVQAIDGAFLGSLFVAGGEASGLEDPSEAPTVRLLGPGKPNPFATSTVITYELPSPGPVDIAIFDAAGRRVRTLVSGPTEAGVHSVRWDGRDAGGSRMAAGVYFVRFKASGSVQAEKLVLAD